MNRRLALFDLDGVLCDDRHRVHHALAREWCEYFGLMGLDKPWRQGRELHDNCIAVGFDALGYCTGRREDTRGMTVAWLREHGYDHRAPLIMRGASDRRPLAEVKADVVTKLARTWDEVWLFDDDPHVIELASTVDRVVAYHCTWYIKPSRLVKKGNS